MNCYTNLVQINMEFIQKDQPTCNSIQMFHAEPCDGQGFRMR